MTSKQSKINLHDLRLILIGYLGSLALPFLCASLHAAQVKSVQRGVTTLAASEATVTIDAVDMSRSILFTSASCNGSAANEYMGAAELVDAATVSFTRFRDSGKDPIIFAWQVVEFESGVFVQRGADKTGNQKDVTLPVLVDPSKSFPLMTYHHNGGVLGKDDSAVIDLVAADTLQFRMGKSNKGGIGRWQLVQYDDCFVQRIAATLPDGVDALDIPITAVNPTKSMVVSSHTITGNINATDLPLVRLNGAENLRIERISNSREMEIVAFVVTFLDDTTVVHGQATLTGASTTTTVELADAPIEQSVVVGPGNFGRQGNGTRGGDAVGSCWFSYHLNDDGDLVIDRFPGKSDADSTAPYQIVSFPFQYAAPVPYVTDFEDGVGPEWSESDQTSASPFTTFLGRFNGKTPELSIETEIGETYLLQFDFFALDSWNPRKNSLSRDWFKIEVSGTPIFHETFSQRTKSFPPSYENPADQNEHLGFGTRSSKDMDGIYRRVTVTFEAIEKITILRFSDGLEERGSRSALDDESWGLDNVSVELARFVDVSTTWNFNQSTSTDSTYASGLHWFDADGDGDLDAILGGNQAKRMLNGGTTFASSTFGTGNERCQHALFDVDNDGDVDFWSGNHESDLNETCFRNGGSADFSDIGSLGFSNPSGNEGVAAADVNRDGWCDIVHFCENDNWIGFHQRDPGASLPSLVGTNDGKYGLSDSGDVGNGDYVSAGDVNDDGFLDLFYHYNGGKLFLSNGDGTYTESAYGINVVTGLDDKFGSAWADYDNDGDLDLFCARWDANNKGNLWRNDIAWGGKVPGSFTIQTGDAAINDESGQFGCAWGDYDNDGDLDLYVATRSGPNKLYQNQGNGTFRMMDEGAGVTGNCQDVVFVDFDNDGDLDIAVTREDDTAVLLENRTNNDNYLKVRVVGAGSGATNTAAIGVRVELWSGDGKTYLGRRDIGVARGLGTEPLWAHFGGVDPAATYQVRTYLHSRDNSNPLVTTVVPQSVSTTIGSTTIPQMLTITEANAKKRIILWRELRNRS